MNFLITGGTGFIGTYLRSTLLKEGHDLAILTRNPENYRGENADNQRFISWDSGLVSEMDKADVVINLAGENLFGFRWTEKVKKSIYDSRAGLTSRLAEVIKKAENPPGLLISASGVNYYKQQGSKPIDESGEPADDFLGRVCKDWEDAAREAEEAGIRVAIARIAPVLEQGGGIVGKMRLPFMMFVGGPIGSGRQYLPWIHMEDICNAILFPLHHEEFNGAYNACSPNSVTMNELAKTMGRVMNRPSFFRVPEPLLKLVLGEAAAPVLGSLNVVPARLNDAGFGFRFSDLEEALADVL